MAAPNFIMSENCQLRTTNLNRDQKYDIGEINFHIPLSTPSGSQVFLILSTRKGLTDIIELQKVSSQGGTLLYKVPMNQKLRINDGEVLIKLLILNGANGTYELSSIYAINITTEYYELARQVYIAQQINAQTQAAYAKILAMTEENRKIYDEIKERG